LKKKWSKKVGKNGKNQKEKEKNNGISFFFFKFFASLLLYSATSKPETLSISFKHNL